MEHKVAVQSTMCVTVLLFLKSVFCNMALGGAKKAAGLRVIEDTYQQQGNKEAEMNADRWQRIVNNDLENIPIGLSVAWASLLTIILLAPTSSDHIYAQTVLVVLFCTCRYLHTYAYFAKLSVFRSLTWFVGMLSVLALALNGTVAAFSDPLVSTRP